MVTICLSRTKRGEFLQYFWYLVCIFRRFLKPNDMIIRNFLVATVLCLLGAIPSYSQNPFIAKYGAIKLSERCFALTEEANNQVGAIWLRNKVNFALDTTFTFVVYFGEKNHNGADGLAFVIHNDPRDTIDDPDVFYSQNGSLVHQQGAIGCVSGGLGYAFHATAQGATEKITPSVAMEFDTWDSNDFQDGAAASGQPASPYKGWDHLSVVYNGDLYNEQKIIGDINADSGRILPLKPSHIYSDPNIEDGRAYIFQLRWTHDPVNSERQTLELWSQLFNNSDDVSELALIATYTDTMIENIFDGETMLRVGFTGTTGGQNNLQVVCMLGEPVTAVDDFAITEVNQPVEIHFTENDTYPFSAQDMTVFISKQPSNGEYDLIENGDGKYLNYTPSPGFIGTDTIFYRVYDVYSDKDFAYRGEATIFVEVMEPPCDTVLMPEVKVLSHNSSCDSDRYSGSVVVNDTLHVLWEEDFDEIADNIMLKEGRNGWSVDSASICQMPGVVRPARAFQQRLQFSKTGDQNSCVVTWETSYFPIEHLDSIFIEYDISHSGNLDVSDFVTLSVVEEEGIHVSFYDQTYQGNFDPGNKWHQIVLYSMPSPKSLKLVFSAAITSEDKFIFVDNIVVTGLQDRTYRNYEWYSGEELIGTDDRIDSLGHGEYSIVALNSEGCKSAPVYFTIEDEPPSIHLGDIVKSNVVDCQETLSGYAYIQEPESGYEYNWYLGAEVDEEKWIYAGDSIFNLGTGSYTVLATDTLSLCASAPETIVIEDLRECETAAPIREMRMYLPSVSAEAGDEIILPVKAVGFKDVSSFEVALERSAVAFELESVAMAFEEGTVSIVDSAGFVAVHWSKIVDEEGLILQDSATLFELVLKVSSQASGEEVISFAQMPLVEDEFGSDVRVYTEDGLVDIFKNILLSGTVLSIKSNPIEGASVSLLSASEYQESITDHIGNYSFTAKSEQLHSIFPQLMADDELTYRGINLLDAILFLEHYLDLNPFSSPYEFLAADITKDKQIDRADFLALVLALMQEPVYINNDSTFLFVSSAYEAEASAPFEYSIYHEVFSNNDSSELDFTAVKLGDIDQSWENVASGRVASSQSASMYLEQGEATGDKVEYWLKVSSFTEMLGAQMTVTFDADQLDFDGLEPAALELYHSTHMLASGTIPLVWIDETLNGITIDDETVIGRLLFTVKDNSKELAVDLGNVQDGNMAINKSKEFIVLESERQAKITGLENLLSQVQIYPNPSKDFLHIYTPTDGKYSYVLTNVEGKTLKQGQFKRTTQIDLRTLPKGIYFVALKDGKGHQRISKVSVQ